MKIAFLGTPEFALPSLQTLIELGWELCVFTQPDRPIGRKMVLTPPPVKVLASKYSLPVYQFEKIRSKEGVEAMKTFAPDLCVTAAFGQLLSAANLDIPTFGTINVHASLLPKYRGASPIQSAIINGDSKTGVTIMLTDIGMDTGDILNQAVCQIDGNETYEQLSSRLSVLGAALLADTIKSIINGTAVRTPQDSALATKCKTLTRDTGRIDLSLPRKRIHDLVRGTNPWPTAFAYLDDKVVKIWKTELCDPDFDTNAPTGSLVGDQKRGLYLKCSDGYLKIIELQAAGAKRLCGNVFLCGTPILGKSLT